MDRMDADVDASAPLYQRIAAQIEAAIASGAMRAGARLPSVRALAQQHAVSMSTALQVYRWLENRGVAEARPKSGQLSARASAAQGEIRQASGLAPLAISSGSTGHSSGLRAAVASGHKGRPEEVTSFVSRLPA